MLQVFYKYASALKPEIDGQLVRTALDKWTWFWILLESVTISFLAFIILLFLEAYFVAALLGLGAIIHGGQPPRSKPLRSRAMGLYLEEACKLKG